MYLPDVGRAQGWRFGTGSLAEARGSNRVEMLLCEMASLEIHFHLSADAGDTNTHLYERSTHSPY